MKGILLAASGMTFAFLVGHSVTARATMLNFAFTTEHGAVGTFVLDTDATISSTPANFGVNPITGEQTLGLSYPDAISELDLSSVNPELSLSNERADFEIAPELPSTLLGISDAEGILSGAVYPTGCATGDRFTCLFTLSVSYTGDVSLLPELSEDPTNYARGLSIDYFEPATSQLVERDFITTLTAKEQIPEPEPLAGLMLLGMFGLHRLVQASTVVYKKD